MFGGPAKVLFLHSMCDMLKVASIHYLPSPQGGKVNDVLTTRSMADRSFLVKMQQYKTRVYSRVKQGCAGAQGREKKIDNRERGT